MKATSIEQVRGHLARGGQVKMHMRNGQFLWVWVVRDGDHAEHPDFDHYELLPLDPLSGTPDNVVRPLPNAVKQNCRSR
jgi:hypothetical protein